jgi:hypothetical protein
LRLTERPPDLLERDLLEQEVDRDRADRESQADLDDPAYDCVTS